MAHAPVFYCPYCGEEDLRPGEGGHGQWVCLACRRVWSVRFVGLATAGGLAAGPGETTEPAEPADSGGGPVSAPAVDRERLAAVARAAGAALEGAPPVEVLRWAIGQFGPRFCIASSMGDAVLATLAAEATGPGGARVDVVFLDTGYHFAETIGTRDAVAAVLPVNVLTILPRQTVTDQDAEYGPRLHDRDPDRCCALRKVEPLARALAPYHAWASGIRRDEATSRREIGVVEWDARRGMVKVNPLATWTQDDVDAYIARAGVLVNPLVYDGYPSIGCAPCTRRVAPGEDARAGRWAGTGKTECGLHG